MKVTATDFMRWYAPRRTSFEWGFWIVTHAVNAAFNSAVRVLELPPGASDPAPWGPVVWECSSALSILLLVWPVVMFTRAWPFRWDRAFAWLGGHLLASVVYSVVHVLLMVAMREAAYALAGGDYSFGPWPGELVYEYLKDVRTYIGVVFLIEGYRFVLRRLRGEARWLDSRDDRPEAPQRRPDRFLVKMLGREFLVPADDIDRAQAAGNYVNLVVGHREYPLRSTMKDLVQRLDPGRFRRIHRSHIVRLDRVAEIEPLESGDARVTLQDGTVLPCSRNYRSELS
jgi:hypothetical protein